MIFRLSATAIAFLLLASRVSAHPGHGVNPQANDPWHYIAEPPHLLMWMAIVACTFVAVRLVRRWAS